jgi:TRAP transporter 4TM/12TM fusion protein
MGDRTASGARTPDAPDEPDTTEAGVTVANTEEVLAEYDEERPARQLGPRLDLVIMAICAVTSVAVLLRVFFPDPAGSQHYRMLFLAVVLPLTLICYRGGRRRARREHGENDNPGVLDWALAAIALVVAAYPLFVFDEYITRSARPPAADVMLGAVLILLVLEACRRTTGWILPIVCVAFIGYAYYGSYLPQDWSIAHRGFDIDAIIGASLGTTEGIYGVPLDVAATYIILFTIYGAVLDASGASKFFIDLSFAAFRRSRTAPGRTVTLAGFLLGTVSGSGTATAVSLGSVAWPVLKRARYPREQAGGVLAAAGIGAILSPPTLGAAAFIIAEFLKVSYGKVLLWACIPTLLYYLGIILAIEIDSRRLGTHAVEQSTDSARRLLVRFGYHFASLALIVFLLAAQRTSPLKAVVAAIVLQVVLSFLDPEHRLNPTRLARALANGTRGVLPVAATCAAAGIIVGVVTETGLGLGLADIVVGAARSITEEPTAVLVLTIVFAAVAILVLGLAVPVTASFIISWVIVAPALVDLGVGLPAVAMFVFYYAVLSEVSPPTALAAVAASAITGGNAFRTMMQTWKYTLPAFLVPCAMVLTARGSGLLFESSAADVLVALVAGALSVVGLAILTGGWVFGPAGWPERVLAGVGALLLLYLATPTVLTGAALLAVAVAVHLILRRRRPVGAVPTMEGTVRS